MTKVYLVTYHSRNGMIMCVCKTKELANKMRNEFMKQPAINFELSAVIQEVEFYE